MSRLRALCEVLGLEFYVGPRRSLGGVDLNVGRLALALEAVTAGFPDAERRLPLHDRAQLDLVHPRNLPGFLVSILFVRKESRLYQGGWCTPRLFVLDFIVVLRIYFSRSPGPLGLVRCSLGVFPVRRDAPQGHARGCPRAVVAPRPLHCLGVLRPGFRPDTERAPRHTACGPGRLRTGQPPASFPETTLRQRRARMRPGRAEPQSSAVRCSDNPVDECLPAPSPRLGQSMLNPLS